MIGEVVMSLFQKIRDIIHVVKLVVYYFYTQEYTLAYRFAGNASKILEECLLELPSELTKEYLPVLEMVIEAIEEQDATKIADIYQEGVLPLLYRTQEIVFETSDNVLIDYWKVNRRLLKERYPELYHKILECRENVPDYYGVSWAKTGDLVLDIATEQGVLRMVSAVDPWEEALYYSEGMKEEEYLLIGFGLGYHVELLGCQAQCKKLVVLENDLNQLAIALSYRDLTSILKEENIMLVHSPVLQDYIEYFKDVTEKTRVCFWQPSVKGIADKVLRETLEDYCLQLSSIRSMEWELQRNFETNLGMQDREVSCLKELFCQKEVILAAAGPSLDEDLEFLRNRDTSKIVLVCVGKVASKLSREGIQPDYIIMTDASQRTRWQIDGIEESGIPLIYLSTVASDVVKAYKGKRYMAFQNGYPRAEQYAKEHQYMLFETGGSVTTFALDVLIQFQCSKVICIGVDMGFPGEKTHAGDIGKSVTDIKNLRQVEGISSKYVYTSKPLDIYRKWIEKRIKDVKDIELINASKGARIHGMKEMNLKDCL